MSAAGHIAAGRPARPRSIRLARLWPALAAACALGIAAGTAAYVMRPHGPARPALPELHGVISWAPGSQPAPPLPALRALRGRTVVLALVGPHCAAGCVLMRKELASVVRRLPAGERPAVVVRPARGVGAAGAVVYLVDRSGNERTGYLLPFAPSFVERDLQVLAEERTR